MVFNQEMAETREKLKYIYKNSLEIVFYKYNKKA